MQVRVKISYPTWSCTCFPVSTLDFLRHMTEKHARMRTAQPIQLQSIPHFGFNQVTLRDIPCKMNGSKRHKTQGAALILATFAYDQKLRQIPDPYNSTMPDAPRPVRPAFYLIFNALSNRHASLHLPARLPHTDFQADKLRVSGVRLIFLNLHAYHPVTMRPIPSCRGCSY